MAEIFEPFTMGAATAPNRLVRAATAEQLCTKEGAPSVRLMSLYRELAQGGSGTIITGYAYVCPDGKPSERSLSLCDDAFSAELRQLADAVHRAKDEDAAPTVSSLPSLEQLRAGARAGEVVPAYAAPDGERALIVAQLVYGGSKSNLAPGDERWLPVGTEGEPDDAAAPTADVVGPSAVRHPGTGIVPREATAQDLARIVGAFADAAARAKRCGFDGVEVHAAHGYLLSQFLDGRFNKRADAYGGSLENRARLAVDCVRAVRKATGPGFPVLVKLNSCDVMADPLGQQGGLSVEESLQVAEWLVDAGATCIDLSGDWHAVAQEDVSGEPFFGDAAARLAVRLAGRAPVIVTGGWRDPDTIERYLSTTNVAAAAMARPLICQSSLPLLWETETRHTSQCISCNWCLGKPGLPCILRKGR